MQAAIEAGCTESDESVSSASASAAIIEEKYNTGGRRRLGPMKATMEVTPAYTAGALLDPFVVRTFVDPAWAPRKRGMIG